MLPELINKLPLASFAEVLRGFLPHIRNENDAPEGRAPAKPGEHPEVPYGSPSEPHAREFRPVFTRSQRPSPRDQRANNGAHIVAKSTVIMFGISTSLQFVSLEPDCR